jgi:hypothetical protein
VSIVVRFNPASMTAEKYDDAVRRHEEAGVELPPDGMEYHTVSGRKGTCVSAKSGTRGSS